MPALVGFVACPAFDTGIMCNHTNAGMGNHGGLLRNVDIICQIEISRVTICTGNRIGGVAVQYD